MFSDRKNLSPRERQVPLPVRILQSYVVLENHSGGATRTRKKFDDIFIRLDTTLACDRHMDSHVLTAKTTLTHSVARVEIMFCNLMYHQCALKQFKTASIGKLLDTVANT